jgi:hypothetical protein
MGIIVNFTNRTVQGFGPSGLLSDFPVRITTMNETTVFFGGSDQSNPLAIHGEIDRVTGDVEARWTLRRQGIVTLYALKCRPAQRMF